MVDSAIFDELSDGNSVRARHEFQQRLDTDPNDVAALFALASINANLRQHIIARDLMRRAYNINPHASIISYRLALCEEKCLKFDTALTLLKTLFNDDQFGHDAIYNYARILVAEKRYDQAKEFCHNHGIIQGNHDIMLLWGTAMSRTNEVELAYKTLYQYFNTDQKLLDLMNWCYEEYQYQYILDIGNNIKPDSPHYMASRNNVKQAYIALQEYNKANNVSQHLAKQCDDVEHNFTHLSILWNRSLFQLGLGPKAEYIEHYHKLRWHTPNFMPFKRFYTNLPYWQGQDLQGKSLLVQCEQGIGDQLFFASYLPYLQHYNATIYLSCNNRLEHIFKQAFPFINVLPGGQELLEPEWVDQHRTNGNSLDYVVEIGSLMHYLKLTDEQHACSAYLKPNMPLAIKLRQALQAKFPNKKLIGITWYSQGENGYHRSIPVSMLEPLCARNDCILINLQYGRLKHHLQALKHISPDYSIAQVSDFDINQNFDNLLALLAALDGAITIDNVTAFFINYANIPNIALINADPVWLWGYQGKKSPWLSNINIAREHVSGNKTNLIDDAMHFIDTLIPQNTA